MLDGLRLRCVVLAHWFPAPLLSPIHFGLFLNSFVSHTTTIRQEYSFHHLIFIAPFSVFTANEVPEDPCKIVFGSSRLVQYSHPRTSMLMFGPKNAPATQMQYLRISHASNDGEPCQYIILTVTQFDGIPMADTFKVLQYWCLERDSVNASECLVRVGCFVYFIKSTMFKGQVIGGVKDELLVGASKWCDFCVNKLIDVQPTAVRAEEERDIVFDDEVTEGKIPSRRSSRVIQEVLEPLLLERKEILAEARFSFFTIVNVTVVVLLFVVVILYRQNSHLVSTFDKLQRSLSDMQAAVDRQHESLAGLREDVRSEIRDHMQALSSRIVSKEDLKDLILQNDNY